MSPLRVSLASDSIESVPSSRVDPHPFDPAKSYPHPMLVFFFLPLPMLVLFKVGLQARMAVMKLHPPSSTSGVARKADRPASNRNSSDYQNAWYKFPSYHLTDELEEPQGLAKKTQIRGEFRASQATEDPGVFLFSSSPFRFSYIHGLLV